MKPWSILQDAIQLWKMGRTNAAKAQWESLPLDFKLRVIKFTTFLFQNKQLLLLMKLEMSSPFGTFVLSDGLANDLRLFIPTIVDG